MTSGPLTPAVMAAAPAPAASPLEAARHRIEGIEGLAPAEQVEAFDAVHRLLQDALAAVEQEQRVDGGRPPQPNQGRPQQPQRPQHGRPHHQQGRRH